MYKKPFNCVIILLSTLLSCTTTTKNPCSAEAHDLKMASAILGIDISNFQNDINWSDIKNDSIHFVYIKATQGILIKDAKFDQKRTSAKNNCIYRGFYHFYVTDNDPKAQAQNFISAVKSLETGDLPPVLDLEKLGLQSTISKETYQKNTLLWLQIVEKELGVQPIIYSNLFFANEYLNHPDYAKYKLWLAEYSGTSPILPETWKNKGWTIWQRTDLKKINGIKGDVDYDLFNGDATAFKQLLKK